MNPSGQPFPSQFGGAPPPPGGGGPAREALNVPGILFMVFGGLAVLYSLMNVVSSGINQAQIQQILDDPNLPSEAKNLIRTLMGPLTKVFALLGLGIGGLLIFGGLQMRNLKSYGIAMAACIIGMIPCTGCVCCLTLPLSIWTLTILTRPEIKASFT